MSCFDDTLGVKGLFEPQTELGVADITAPLAECEWRSIMELVSSASSTFRSYHR